MKTSEKIQKRIDFNNQLIDQAEKDAKTYMGRVSEKVTKYAYDPEYVAKWLDTWMGDVTSCNKLVAALLNENQILTWVLSE